MTTYSHTQPATFIRWAIGLVVLFFAGLAITIDPSEPKALIGIGVVIILLIACLFLFHALTIELTGNELVARFGPGLIRKTISLSSITSVHPVRNHWYYGWGIRLTPHGWLWNVSGFDAVELLLENGRKFRLGTDEAVTLCAAIQEAIPPRSGEISAP